MTDIANTNVLKALHKAQGQFLALTKNAKNPHLKNKYADLNAIKEATGTALHEAGLVIVDEADGNGDVVELTTYLYHIESGERLASSFIGKAEGRNLAQAIGSLHTYGRRYNRLCLLDLQAEDDDGNSGPQRKPSQPSQPQQPPHPLDLPALDGDNTKLGNLVQNSIQGLQTVPGPNAKAYAENIFEIVKCHHDKAPQDERINKAMKALSTAIGEMKEAA